MRKTKSSWLKTIFILATASILSAGCAEKCKSPRITFIIAEPEYNSWQTLPRFAKDVLEEKYKITPAILIADMNRPNEIAGLANSIRKADLLVLSIRRQAFPADDLNAVRKHLSSGKPLVAIRTSSHAFDARGDCPAGHLEWAKFDIEVLGGDYNGHYKRGIKSTVTIAPAAESHPILAGIKTPFISNGSLYRSSPLADSAKALLVGSIPNEKPEPVAWTNTYKKARIFYTSLGHPDDFERPEFRRLLENAIFWALEK
jgi:type 1 glutamine amidotransferase